MRTTCPSRAVLGPDNFVFHTTDYSDTSHVPLDRKGLWHHIDAMTTQLTRQVQRAIEAVPCSIRALAREAGVPQSTLVRIQSGKREATLAVAQAIAGALSVWSKTCTKAADSLVRAISKKGD